MRYLWLIFLLPLYGLFGQPFPAALILEASKFAGHGIWHPDWPLDLPPDSFTSDSDDWVSITVGFGENSFQLRRNGEDITEFPWFFEGRMVQLSLNYFPKNLNTVSYLRMITFDNLDTIEILEYSLDYPSLLRIYREGIYYFVLMDRGTGFIKESWFDQEGYFLENYEYSFRPGDGAERIRSFNNSSGIMEGRRDFDSRFLITSISGLEGDFSLHYNGNSLPVYWQRQPLGMEKMNYSFQWDARELLVRLSTSDEDIRDFRYEYSFDNRGNWIERREIIMVPNSGLLLQYMGSTVRRFLEYSTNE